MSKRTLEESEIRDSESKRNRPATPSVIRKQRHESQCPCTSLGKLYEYSSDIFAANTSTHQNGLQDSLKEQYHTVCCGGREEEKPISDLDKSFLEECYPKLSEETYSWPLTFEPSNSSDSTSELCEGAYNWPRTLETGSKFGRYNNRRGDEAEQKTFLMMRTMLKSKKIPSFTICGYEWMKYLPIKLLDYLKKRYQGDMFKQGESDLLVLVPNKGVLVVEVKSTMNINTIEMIQEKCFKQCMKAIKFVTYSVFDLITHKKVNFIKVASLPNCPRSYLTTFTCDKCRLHYITKDDLECTEKLSEWFEEVTCLFSKCEFDLETYAGLVSRLIGPQSRVQVKVISEVTDDTHRKLELQGPHEPIKSKWVQLNRTQWEKVQENPKFLWITGDPGTGKTVLAQWKIQNIFRSELPTKHVVYFMAGNKDMLFIEQMKTTCKSYIRDKSRFELRIEPFENLFKKTDGNGLQGVMNVVKRLKLKHEACFLSVIIDEFWTVKTDDFKEKDVFMEDSTLQNVWIIQNPLCKEIPSPSDLRTFHFKTVELEKVMRMSVLNVKFLNQWLSREYKVGHAFQGLLPILYKMDCICEKLQCEEEQICIPFLIEKITEEYITNYQKTWPKGNKKLSISEDIAVITKRHIKVKKLLMKKQLQVTVRPALYFTGCEKKVIIVDIRNVGGSRNYEGNITEALTRTTGILVLLDVSCANDTLQMQREKITEHIDTLHECSKKGFIESNNSVTFSEAELSMLRREIRLGLHRDEHEFQENLGSAVTEKILQDAIAPLKNNVRDVSKKVDTLDENLSKRVETLDENVSKRVDTLDENLSKRVETLDENVSKRVETLEESVSKRVETLDKNVSKRVENLDKNVSENKEALNRIETTLSALNTSLPALLGLSLQSNHFDVSGGSKGDHEEKPSNV